MSLVRKMLCGFHPTQALRYLKHNEGSLFLTLHQQSKKQPTSSLSYCQTMAVPMMKRESHEDQRRRNSGQLSNKFLMVGILGFLGLKDEDEELTGEDKIVHTIKLAKLSQQRNDLKKAEKLLHLALKMAHDLQHYKAQKYIIDEMANNAFQMGDLPKAEKLFKETLKSFLADGMKQDDNAIIHISAKLSNLYGRFQEESKALEGFRFCLDHLEAKILSGSEDFDTLALYSLVLCWFGEFQYVRKAGQESLDLLKKSHEVSVNINGPHHDHSLTVLNSMAASYSLLNQLDEAVKCLQTVITLAQENLLTDDLPYYYVNLTNIYLTQLNNPKADLRAILHLAMESSREALRLAKKAGDVEAVQLAEKCMATVKEYLSK